MPQITVYNQKGEKVGTTTLDPTIFAVPERPDLIHQAVVYQMSAERRPIADTKTRAEVRGGGRKPWRQKGTGRARVGSIRSPIWRGGGVVFGPTKKRNFKKKMPKKMRNLALFSALSNKLKTKKIILLDGLEFKNIKTKQVEEMLNKLPIKEGTILLVLPKLEPKIILSCHNLPYLKAITTPVLNVIDVLKYDWLIFTKDALKKIEEIYLK
jgi:large subunit ribosomal protein L4